MKIECCGKSVSTPFCPYCGKAIGSEFSLVNYLILEQAALSRKKDSCNEKLQNNELPSHLRLRYTSQIKTLEAKSERLGEWIKWVEARIEK